MVHQYNTSRRGPGVAAAGPSGGDVPYRAVVAVVAAVEQ